MGGKGEGTGNGVPPCPPPLKSYISAKKVYFDQHIAFIFYYCAIFNSLSAGLFPIPSGCQTVWVQIRPDILSSLIWVQTVCKGYQQMTKVLACWQRVKYIKTSWYYFLAKTLFKVNFICLQLKCWLQQILSQGKP